PSGAEVCHSDSGWDFSSLASGGVVRCFLCSTGMERGPRGACCIGNSHCRRRRSQSYELEVPQAAGRHRRDV
ncbi:hypothetical protein BGZ91_008377, partial [Linnemannia elongata]